MSCVHAPNVYAAQARTTTQETGGESYQFTIDDGGKPVTTVITLFNESPRDNPDFLGQVRSLGLDHVAFYREIEQSRNPSESDALEQLREAVETTGTPTVEIRQKKGLLKRLGDVYRLAFKHPDRLRRATDLHYGIVSTFFETGLYTAMIITAGDTPIANAAGLLAAQSWLSYKATVRNTAFQYLWASSIKHPGETVSATTNLARQTLWDYVTSQAFKLIQHPSSWLSTETQVNIGINSIMSAAGDIPLTMAAEKAYATNLELKAKVNFYTGFVGQVLSSLDLMQHNLLPVLYQTNVYEFTMSGALLLGYYAATIIAIKKWPVQFGKAVDKFDRGLKRVLAWGRKTFNRCSHNFENQLPPPGDSIASSEPVVNESH
ncbi:MAG: hypothetical protein JST80_10720 [Bdellovibrionales bacterium]|nr:hypothetical protein [Bdellovibrionales bacterium]